MHSIFTGESVQVTDKLNLTFDRDRIPNGKFATGA